MDAQQPAKRDPRLDAIERRLDAIEAEQAKWNRAGNLAATAVSALYESRKQIRAKLRGSKELLDAVTDAARSQNRQTIRILQTVPDSPASSSP